MEYLTTAAKLAAFIKRYKDRDDLMVCIGRGGLHIVTESLSFVDRLEVSDDNDDE